MPSSSLRDIDLSLLAVVHLYNTTTICRVFRTQKKFRQLCKLSTSLHNSVRIRLAKFSFFCSLRDVNVMSATGMMTPEMLRWGGAVAAAAAAAAVPNSQQDIQPMPKRPRMDMGHHQSSQGPPPAMAPLRIDTGDNKVG